MRGEVLPGGDPGIHRGRLHPCMVIAVNGCMFDALIPRRSTR